MLTFGLFGFAAAWRAGRDGSVLLVEPDPGLCAVLERSVERLAGRGYAPTAIACCAALDRAGPVRFRIAARGRATNAVTGFGPGPRGGVRRTLVVRSTSLDGLLGRPTRPIWSSWTRREPSLPCCAAPRRCCGAGRS